MSAFIINVTFDAVEPRRLAEFWAAVTGYEPESVSDEVVRLRATDPRGVRRLIFWKVPEPKTAKTRVHIDLATKDGELEVERLKSLGAIEVARFPAWTVMADPEGNEFCVG